MIRLMPRDVATHWNSTFDLLEFALKHRKAVDLLTQWRELGLRKFKLCDNEWVIVEQLHSMLKVSNTLSRLVKHIQTQFDRFSRMPLSSSRAQHQTLRRSSRRWTISINSSRHIHVIRIIFSPSILVSLWLSGPSTVTTAAQTPQRCIRLQWVSSLLTFHSLVS